MKTSRGFFASVVCGDYIYAIGGHSEEADKRAEKYDTCKNKWEEVDPMNRERWGHSAWVEQNKIFVIGGMNAKFQYVREVECYDFASDTWSIVGQTDVDLFGHALVLA